MTGWSRRLSTGTSRNITYGTSLGWLVQAGEETVLNGNKYLHVAVCYVLLDGIDYQKPGIVLYFVMKLVKGLN